MKRSARRLEAFGAGFMLVMAGVRAKEHNTTSMWLDLFFFAYWSVRVLASWWQERRESAK